MSAAPHPTVLADPGPQDVRERAASAAAWVDTGLVRAARARAGLAPVLRHRLHGDDDAVFCDEVIARVRGMLDDIATQLAAALADVGAPAGAAPEPAEADTLALADLLHEEPTLLAALHAQALEWQLATRLEREQGIDMILAPAVAAGLADPALGTAAQALLAAQTRHVQARRRMTWPLAELPQDLFRIALHALHLHAGDHPDLQSRAIVAERSLRLRHDAERARPAVLRRYCEQAGSTPTLLDPAHAGLALFLTALAAAMGGERDEAVLLTTPAQLPRLVLVLRAAGLDGETVRHHVQRLHPDAVVPTEIAAFAPVEAAARLARDRLGTA